jgi:hypothetical protein
MELYAAIDLHSNKSVVVVTECLEGRRQNLSLARSS